MTLTPNKRTRPVTTILKGTVYVLPAAAAVIALPSHWVDTAVIIGVVVINSIIGFIQDGRAEQAMEAIRRM